MKKPIVDKETVQDIAIELGVSPSFIEKDFYACKILDELSSFDYENTKLIFTGGTCLSKGYGIIKRFSEDIDFRISTSVSFNRTDKKKFRQAIINKFKQIEYIEVLEDTLLKRNSSEFFSFYIKYPKHFEADASLRSNLKLEFTFEEVLLATDICEIQSILEEYTNNFYKTQFECISPIEIGANKLSALIWRIDARTRKQNNEKDAGTVLRHLHDLAALEDSLMHDDFIRSVQLSFEADKGRGGSNRVTSLTEFATLTLNRLKSNNRYSSEYKEFVDALSYAQESDTIDFSKAMASLERILDFLHNNSNKI